MKVYQREIVELPFNLTQGVQNHPALVLSTNEAIELEDSFIAVMLTSEKMDDEFTFIVSNEMFESGIFTTKYSEVRLHLVSYFRNSDVIINKHSRMKIKQSDFNRIIKQIVRIVFGQKI